MFNSKRLNRAYQRLFEMPDGKVVLGDLLSRFHGISSTFVEGSPDLSAFREGERNVILYILSRLYGNEETYLDLLQEKPWIETEEKNV